MSITYAGVDLLLENGRIREMCERHRLATNQSILDSHLQRLEPQACVRSSTSIPRYPNRPHLNFNELYWPTGASRFSLFWAIADTNRLKEIQDVSFSAGRVRGKPLALDHGLKTPISTEMYMLPPRALTTGLVEATDKTEKPTLWAIPLVDIRFYWQMSGSDVILEDGDTWSDLFNLVDSFLETITIEGNIDSDYQEPDSSAFNRSQQNAAIIADIAAYSCGRRIVRELNGGLTLLDWDTSGDRLTDNLESDEYKPWCTLMGWKFGKDDDKPALIDGLFPQYVRVAFPKYEEDIRNTSGEWEIYDKTDEDNKGVVDAVKMFRSTARADFTTGSSSPDNDSVLDGLATQIAADYRKSLEQHFDYAFAGLKHWKQTGWCDAVKWSFRHEEDECFPHTRIWSLPYNFHPEELLQSDGWHEPDEWCWPGIFVAKADEDIGTEDSGDCSWLDDAYTDNGGDQFTAYNHMPTGTVTSGDRILVARGGGKFQGKWVIVAVDCDA